jgi:hypothetical protein
MTDTTDRAVQALAKKIADYLRELVHAERPTQDVWWEALGLAVADSVVRNVTAYDQPEVTSDLVAYIEARSVLKGTIRQEKRSAGPRCCTREDEFEAWLTGCVLTLGSASARWACWMAAVGTPWDRRGCNRCRGW